MIDCHQVETIYLEFYVFLPTVHSHWKLIVEDVNSYSVLAKSGQLARKTAGVVAW